MREKTTCWRVEITKELGKRGESWADLLRVTFGPTAGERRDYLDEEDAATLPDHADHNACLDRKFDPGWGGTEGNAFTAWTEKRVYFPACYDGSEWVASVPRHPCDEATEHIGG